MTFGGRWFGDETVKSRSPGANMRDKGDCQMTKGIIPYSFNSVQCCKRIHQWKAHCLLEPTKVWLWSFGKNTPTQKSYACDTWLQPLHYALTSLHRVRRIILYPTTVCMPQLNTFSQRVGWGDYTQTWLRNCGHEWQLIRYACTGITVITVCRFTNSRSCLHYRTCMML